MKHAAIKKLHRDKTHKQDRCNLLKTPMRNREQCHTQKSFSAILHPLCYSSTICNSRLKKKHQKSSFSKLLMKTYYGSHFQGNVFVRLGQRYMPKLAAVPKCPVMLLQKEFKLTPDSGREQ